MYYIKDSVISASESVLQLADKEQAFAAEYFKRTGVRWIHYYGPNGPRAPPVLYMWPAKAVGDVHRIVSKEGYW